MRKNRSQATLLQGLESILYEIQILASALLLRDRRYFFKEYPGLPWGPPQIAHDVIRLKSRLILDFFYPTNPQSDDMIVDDCKISGPYTTLNSNEVQELKQFVRRVNK